jgi:hypothetical protein
MGNIQRMQISGLTVTDLGQLDIDEIPWTIAVQP